MSSWHQDQAVKRHFEECRKRCVSLSNPYAHETKWTVLNDPPGGSMSASTHDTEEQAMVEYAKCRHNRLIEPMCVSHT